LVGATRIHLARPMEFEQHLARAPRIRAARGHEIRPLRLREISGRHAFPARSARWASNQSDYATGAVTTPACAQVRRTEHENCTKYGVLVAQVRGDHSQCPIGRLQSGTAAPPAASRQAKRREQDLALLLELLARPMRAGGSCPIKRQCFDHLTRLFLRVLCCTGPVVPPHSTPRCLWRVGNPARHGPPPPPPPTCGKKKKPRCCRTAADSVVTISRICRSDAMAESRRHRRFVYAVTPPQILSGSWDVPHGLAARHHCLCNSTRRGHTLLVKARRHPAEVIWQFPCTCGVAAMCLTPFPVASTPLLQLRAFA